MSPLSFKVWSPYSGLMDETVEVTRPLGTTTLDKVIRAAHENGWMIELGYAIVPRDHGTGSVAFVNGRTRLTMEVGVKGQLTWLCVTNVDFPRGRVVSSKRYETALHFITADKAELTRLVNDLQARIPGLGAEEASQLVAKVERDGRATWALAGRTFEMTPSRIAGSRAIWIKEV